MKFHWVGPALNAVCHSVILLRFLITNMSEYSVDEDGKLVLDDEQEANFEEDNLTFD